MPYRYKGIEHTNAGAVVTRAGPAPIQSERSDGWAYDASGRAFIVTAGTPSYRQNGMTFTADGSLLTVNAAPNGVSDYVWQGIRFRSDGWAYQSTLRVP